MVQERAKPKSKNFGDDLEKSVAKTNWPEMRNKSRVFYFLDECNKHVVKPHWQMTYLE